MVGMRRKESIGRDMKASMTVRADANGPVIEAQTCSRWVGKRRSSARDDSQLDISDMRRCGLEDPNKKWGCREALSRDGWDATRLLARWKVRYLR